MNFTTSFKLSIIHFFLSDLSQIKCSNSESEILSNDIHNGVLKNLDHDVTLVSTS